MPSIDQHPSPEQLVAYHERRLTVDEAEAVRSHLVACADCTAELLELVDLLDGEGDGVARAEMPRAELDAAWRKQRERLPQVVSLEERRADKAPRRRSWATAVAMGLAAALAFVVVAQWRTIDRLRQPQANPPLINLLPAESTRTGSPEASELRFSKGEEWAWVILNPSGDLDSSRYGVVITTAGGQEVLSFHDLRSSEAGNLRLGIPRTALKEGDYKIHLLREEGGLHQILEEFELKVRHLL